MGYNIQIDLKMLVLNFLCLFPYIYLIECVDSYFGYKKCVVVNTMFCIYFHKFLKQKLQHFNIKIIKSSTMLFILKHISVNFQ